MMVQKRNKKKKKLWMKEEKKYINLMFNACASPAV
jgi:hypothetical protein